MSDPDELRARAAHYRKLAGYTDARARAGIIELATQYDQQAADMEADQEDQGEDAAG